MFRCFKILLGTIAYESVRFCDTLRIDSFSLTFYVRNNQELLDSSFSTQFQSNSNIS